MRPLNTKSLFLDIETSGLHKQKDYIISMGVLFLDTQGQPVLKHWFLENKEEEKSLLESFLLFLSNYDTVYTYNGKGFDYPFILKRLHHYQLDSKPFLNLQLVDVKVGLKHFSPNRKGLETLFGFKRQSSTSGREVVKLYETYLSCKTPIYSSLIIKHQEDELRSLWAFYELYTLILHFSDLRYLDSKQEKDQLILTLEGAYCYKHSFEGNILGIQLKYQEGYSLVHLHLPLIDAEFKHYLEPIKDYYYIDSQAQLMHKSLAQFIPASLRRRATKEECCITKSSCYLRVYTTYKLTAPLWYDDNKNFYIELNDFSPHLLAPQLFWLFFKKNLSEIS